MDERAVAKICMLDQVRSLPNKCYFSNTTHYQYVARLEQRTFSNARLSFTPKSVNLLTYCRAHNRRIKKRCYIVTRPTADLFTEKYRTDLRLELSIVTRVGKAWKIVPRLDDPGNWKQIVLDAQIMEDRLCQDVFRSLPPLIFFSPDMLHESNTNDFYESYISRYIFQSMRSYVTKEEKCFYDIKFISFFINLFYNKLISINYIVCLNFL